MNLTAKKLKESADTTPLVISYTRFSTKEQEKGDSERRQIKAAEKWSTERGYTLDDSHKLIDKGLSAFHGTHRAKGKLGEFLRRVEQGEFPGDRKLILIVENLDRLSREQPFDAQYQFMSLIEAGIKIVTLHDGMEYDRESINENWTKLISSIIPSARGHEESATKSKRGKATWEQKDTEARTEGKTRTRRFPGWIEEVKLPDGTTRRELIPVRAAAIDFIFLKKLQGKGSRTIARELNQDPDIWKPPPGKRNKTGGWWPSYINKLLRDRRLIGEDLPHTVDKIKGRQPRGEPIKDYFPRAIDEDLFDQVQAYLDEKAQMKGRAGGNPGKGKNLFKNVVKCGICGSSMHFMDKGKAPKGAKYLICDSVNRKNEVPIPIKFKMVKKSLEKLVAIRLMGRERLGRTKDEELPKTTTETRMDVCPAKAVRYDEFEDLFFADFDEWDPTELVPNEDETNARIRAIEGKLIANDYRIKEIDQQVENLTDQITRTKDSGARDRYERKMLQLEADQKRFTDENKALDEEVRQLRALEADLRHKRDTLKEFCSLEKSAKNDKERIELRLKQQNQIQRTFEWIKIYPLMEEYKEFEETEEPGIALFMKSKFIEKVRMKFRKLKKIRLLYPKSYGEIID